MQSAERRLQIGAALVLAAVLGGSAYAEDPPPFGRTPRPEPEWKQKKQQLPCEEHTSANLKRLCLEALRQKPAEQPKEQTQTGSGGGPCSGTFATEGLRRRCLERHGLGAAPPPQETKPKSRRSGSESSSSESGGGTGLPGGGSAVGSVGADGELSGPGEGEGDPKVVGKSVASPAGKSAGSAAAADKAGAAFGGSKDDNFKGGPAAGGQMGAGKGGGPSGAKAAGGQPGGGSAEGAASPSSQAGAAPGASGYSPSAQGGASSAAGGSAGTAASGASPGGTGPGGTAPARWSGSQPVGAMPDVNAKLTSRAVPLAEGAGEKEAARAGKRSRYRRASSGDAETEERIRRLLEQAEEDEREAAAEAGPNAALQAAAQLADALGDDTAADDPREPRLRWIESSGRRLSAAERADLKAQLEELKVPGGRVESVLGAIERRKLKALPPPSAGDSLLSWWRRLVKRLREWWSRR